MFTCGVPVFLINVSCMSWLKFHYSPAASWTVTAIATIATAGWAHTQNNWGFHIAKSQGGRGGAYVPGVGAATHSPSGMPFDWHLPPRSEQRGGPGVDSRPDRMQHRRTDSADVRAEDVTAEEVVDVVVENGTHQSTHPPRRRRCE